MKNIENVNFIKNPASASKLGQVGNGSERADPSIDASFEVITNEFIYNLNNNMKLPHHEIFRLPKKSPCLRKKYSGFLKHLSKLAKNSNNNDKTYLNEIIRKTSDAEEQYALVVFYWKCKGIKASTCHSYKKISEKEAKEIVELHKQGWSIYSIAKHFNRHTSTIHYFLKRMEVAK